MVWLQAFIIPTIIALMHHFPWILHQKRDRWSFYTTYAWTSQLKCSLGLARDHRSTFAIHCSMRNQTSWIFRMPLPSLSFFSFSISITINVSRFDLSLILFNLLSKFDPLITKNVDLNRWVLLIFLKAINLRIFKLVSSFEAVLRTLTCYFPSPLLFDPCLTCC